MRAYRSFVAGCAVIAAVAVSGLVGAGQQVPVPPNTPRPPMAPTTKSGMSVTPGLEGWFRNADGTGTILIGYMNRNQDQVLDIPDAEVIVGKTPSPPEGYEIARVDVVVRLRRKS